MKDAAGVPGIWFYSLDCNQPLGVLGARKCEAILPGMDSQMGKGLQRTGCVVDAVDVQVYASERV